MGLMSWNKYELCIHVGRRCQAEIIYIVSRQTPNYKEDTVEIFDKFGNDYEDYEID